MNPTSIQEDVGLIPGHIALSSGVGRRCSSDPAFLWLQCRMAAVAPIQPLAWELSYLSYAAVVALKNKNKNKTPKTKNQKSPHTHGLLVVGPRDRGPLHILWPLHSEANICLPNICFSISMSIAFLSFEVPNHYHDSLLPFSEDGI